SRNRLTCHELALALLRRQELYEALNPSSKHGGNPGLPGGGKAPRDERIASFADQVERIAGIKKRSAQNLLKIAKDITPETAKIIHCQRLADTVTELIVLSQIKESETQARAAQAVVGRENEKVSEFLKSLETPIETGPTESRENSAESESESVERVLTEET